MVKKKSVKKTKSLTKAEKDDLLIENFVSLQKAMTHLSLKFETLSDNLSRFLEVLEKSAKGYLSKASSKDELSPEISKQVEYLIDQNKALAEGLLLIDDTLRKKDSKGEVEGSTKRTPSNQRIRSKPLPRLL